MSRQRTWFWIFASAEVALVLLLAATALSWSNGIGLLERYQAGDASVTIQQLDDIDSMVQLLSILAIVAIVVRLVTLVGWLHSCVRLIADEHLGTLSHAPGWAIGAWFVPFLNLVRVPRIFMDVQAAGETRSRVLKAPSTIVVWWIVFVGLAIVDRALAAPTTGEGIDYIRRLSTEATESTATQLIEALVTVPLVLGLTHALGRRLASARSERARLAAFPAPAVGLDPSAYAAYPVPTSAPYAAPAPVVAATPFAAPTPPPAGTYPPAPAPVPTWAPPSEPGATSALPGSAPSAPNMPTGNAYYPLAPGAPGAGTPPTPPAPAVPVAATTDPQERVRILSDHEKAELATQPPPSTDAGWYDDPLHAGGRRYWNGAQWTGRVIPGA